jgi:hypothetical protein
VEEGDCVSKVSLLRYNQPSISLPSTWGTFRGNLAGSAVEEDEEEEEEEEEEDEEDEFVPEGMFWVRCRFRGGGWVSIFAQKGYQASDPECTVVVPGLVLG